MRWITPMLCAGLVAGLSLPQPRAQAQAAPVEVITDTPQYCAELVQSVREAHDASSEVERLLDEGRQLCARNEVRGGVMRLRRALLLIHHRERDDR